MPIPRRFGYPAILATCGLASFALVLGIRWPDSTAAGGARDLAPAAQRLDGEARRDVTEAVLADPVPPTPGMPAHDFRASQYGSVVGGPPTPDVTAEPTEVMQPAPTQGAADVEPTGSVELVEGEPVTPAG
jgi:hypothetical protein